MVEIGIKERVEAVLDRLRPAIQAHGGDVELVDVVEGIVRVSLMGACGTCSMSLITLKDGIEATLKEEIPEVVRVESANY